MGKVFTQLISKLGGLPNFGGITDVYCPGEFPDGMPFPFKESMSRSIRDITPLFTEFTKKQTNKLMSTKNLIYLLFHWQLRFNISNLAINFRKYLIEILLFGNLFRGKFLGADWICKYVKRVR